MTAFTARFFLALIFFLLVNPFASRSQGLDAALEKILNPVPEYDPFEKPLDAPKFFPDAVDKGTREILADALTGKPDRFGEHLNFLKQEDARLRKEHKTTTGLAEHVQDLINNTIQDRERFLKAQKDALKNASTPERKRYLESIINHDDLNQADQLMRQSSANRWGGLLNRLLSSVDLVGAASGNYVGAAAETFVNQVYALANRDMSLEERRALARHLDHLKRFPGGPRNAEIQKQIEKLEATKKNALVKKQLDKSEEEIARGEFDRALFHAELGSFLDPESKRAEKLLQKITTSRQTLVERGRKGLSARAEKTLSKEQEEDMRRLLSTLSLRDPVQIERAAIEIEKKNRGTPLGAAAIDTEAVAMEIRGRHDVAKKLLQQLARSSPAPDLKQRAAALLASPQYNLLASFDSARSERRLESAKYVLLGEDLLKRNILYAAGALAAAGPAGAATLGVVNALMVGNNLVNVLSNNPISAQAVIDAGIAYIRNHADTESASEVYKVLADAYAEGGLFDKAINFYELAGTPPEKLAPLKDKAAKAMLNVAAKSKGRGTQEYYLTTIIDEYPETAAAAEATKRLAEMAKRDHDGLRMSKQFLMENPEIYGPGGLGLKATLFDGDARNMEIADRGVNLLNDNELIIYYQTPWGVRSQGYPLARKTVDQFFVALRQKNHQIASADINRRAKGSVGGIKNLPAEIRHGTLGKGNERPEGKDGTTLSLVREAPGSPNYPRVLDHEFLSENERDPASKYKLPPIQGSISSSRVNITGALPTGLWGNQVAIGSDQRSPFAGVQLPLPLLEGFIPVDFMVQGRPGGFSIYPRIHMRDDKSEDSELYR
jgi:hypothetical protein